MADELKPAGSSSTTPPLGGSTSKPPTPSGLSPLSPDIKIPPNLPTKDLPPTIAPPTQAIPKPLSTPSFSPPPTISPGLGPVIQKSPLTTPMPSKTASVPVVEIPKSTVTTPPTSPTLEIPTPKTPIQPPQIPRSLSSISITQPPAPGTPFTAKPVPEAIKPPAPPVKIEPPPTVFKSSIRTMQDDIVAIKKGQAPMGFKIEKQSEKEVKPSDMPIINQPGETQISPKIELGKLQRSKSMAGIPGFMPQGTEKPKAPVAPVPEIKVSDKSSDSGGLSKIKLKLPSINLPSTSGIFERFKGVDSKIASRKLIWVAAGVLVIVVAVIVWFSFSDKFTQQVSESNPPEVTPEYTATVTPTEFSGPSLESIFSINSQAEIVAGSDIFKRLINSITLESLAPGQPGLYKISDPQTNRNYTFSDFATNGTIVGVSGEIIQAVDSKEFYLSLFRDEHASTSYSYAFIARLSSEANVSLVSNWEINMVPSLQNLFELNASKAATPGFLDNSYKNSTIRYKNFPEPTHTIDYSIVTSSNGIRYLVFANSRAHIYAIIDLLTR